MRPGRWAAEVRLMVTFAGLTLHTSHILVAILGEKGACLRLETMKSHPARKSPAKYLLVAGSGAAIGGPDNQRLCPRGLSRSSPLSRCAWELVRWQPPRR